MSVPSAVTSSGGAIEVVLVEGLLSRDGDACYGRWLPSVRRIELESAMHPTAMALTLWHEWVHAALWDAGVHLKPKVEERVADAIALARVREDAP